MQLWHFHSKILDGFYASEVYLIADGKDQAVERALEAYDHWVADRIDTYGTHPILHLFPEDYDEEELAQVSAVRESFKAEAHQLLEPVPTNWVILHKS
jgi:hypothetical protein